MVTDIADAKRSLRALARGARTRSTTLDALLVDRLLDLPLPVGCVVAGIWPLRDEPVLTTAWRALHARGHPVVLPETTPPGQALIFRLWHPDRALLAGRHATQHPDGACRRPDIVFVPLLAWDRHMHRLGYGGGYYDRTLATLPDAPGIGVGYAGQEVASLPVGPHDRTLDAIVTERETVTPADWAGKGLRF